ncbi:MAG: YbaB/EbfC family nucleoid-associated protein [Chlamydiales bacterium]|nr:YbaB/EbfC family nucleoid-associated protein [Chlamydiales bacterium]
MKKQARQMEEQMEKMREEMKAKQVIGSAGNGLVQVTLNGEKELQSIQIRPECVDPSDLEGLQDLIRAACKEAYEKIDAESGAASGLSFPFGL